MLPDTSYRRSFLAALEEEPGAVYLVVDEPTLRTPAGFAAYVARLLDERRLDESRGTDRVPSTVLWWVEDGAYLGRVAIRHRLNDRLRVEGGHIGYWMRPSARGRGHGSAAFRASLPYAAELGIDPALVTCDDDNEASRRIIEGAGGVPDWHWPGILHFWVPTGRARQSSSR